MNLFWKDAIPPFGAFGVHQTKTASPDHPPRPFSEIPIPQPNRAQVGGGRAPWSPVQTLASSSPCSTHRNLQASLRPNSKLCLRCTWMFPKPTLMLCGPLTHKSSKNANKDSLFQLCIDCQQCAVLPETGGLPCSPPSPCMISCVPIWSPSTILLLSWEIESYAPMPSQTQWLSVTLWRPDETHSQPGGQQMALLHSRHGRVQFFIIFKTQWKQTSQNHAKPFGSSSNNPASVSRTARTC